MPWNIYDMHSFYFLKQNSECEAYLAPQSLHKDCRSVSSSITRQCFGTKGHISLQKKGIFSIDRDELKGDWESKMWEVRMALNVLI